MPKFKNLNQIDNAPTTITSTIIHSKTYTFRKYKYHQHMLLHIIHNYQHHLFINNTTHKKNESTYIYNPVLSDYGVSYSIYYEFNSTNIKNINIIRYYNYYLILRMNVYTSFTLPILFPMYPILYSHIITYSPLIYPNEYQYYTVTWSNINLIQNAKHDKSITT